MKKLGIFLILFAMCFCTSAQNSKFSLEINPFIRYDRTNEFFAWETVLGGKSYVKPSGISYGLNVNGYKYVGGSSNIYLGVGYYKHTVSNVKSRNDRGVGKERLINFPSPLFIPFFTDKYAYNTFTVNVGYERLFELKNKYLINTGIGLNGLHTFSQKYLLTSNPEGSVDYRKNNSGLFGLFAGFDIGIMKNYNKITIGPKLKIPVFSIIKTDATFPNETGTNYRNQWFSGIGLGVSFIYKLKTTKK